MLYLTDCLDYAHSIMADKNNHSIEDFVKQDLIRLLITILVVSAVLGIVYFIELRYRILERLDFFPVAPAVTPAIPVEPAPATASDTPAALTP